MTCPISSIAVIGTIRTGAAIPSVAFLASPFHTCPAVRYIRHRAKSVRSARSVRSPADRSSFGSRKPSCIVSRIAACPPARKYASRCTIRNCPHPAANAGSVPARIFVNGRNASRTKWISGSSSHSMAVCVTCRGNPLTNAASLA